MLIFPTKSTIIQSYFIQLYSFEVISLSVTLHTFPREQAGSETYNRYEYQVHWIVCQIVSRLSQNSDCIIFCEYHDDMAEMPEPSKNIFEYYQIKTKDDCSDWTVIDLSKKAKRKDNTYKHSFLGFIFYNFMQFGTECAHCSFVSNATMDLDIRTWQTCIEDEGILQNEHPQLYNKIKQRLLEEYGMSKPSNFDEIFDRFIQNTSVITDTLQLNAYEEQTQSRFFSYLKDQKLPTDTAYLIFDQIINDVRRKSKEPITLPISKKTLISKKGIRISDISSLLRSKAIKTDVYADFRVFLNTIGLSEAQISSIVAGKIAHDIRWNNIEDINYQRCITVLRPIVSQCIAQNEDDIQIILHKCADELVQQALSLSSLDANLIEVLVYERKYANKGNQ